jgi:hypothetical protein
MHSPSQGNGSSNDPKVIRTVDELERRFEGLPELLTPSEVCELVGVAPRTIADWRYRKKTYKTPDGLFHYFGKIPHIKRDVLKKWWLTRRGFKKKGK